NSYTGGFGGGNDYYYRIDYVYTGKDADGNVIYSDMTTGTVKQTALDFHSFTSAATAEHDGHSFDLVGEAYQASGLTGTTFFKPHVFTVYYEFTEIVDEPPIDVPDDDVPLGDLPEDDEPLEDLPEEDVPLADVPKTGDSSMIWLAMTLISALCLAVLTIEEVKARLAAKNEE
ncbi:MAG TPA: doubled motif LPXTG anchor domain-containing protein, partial [Bacillota bacterium]|nr:doubled motif LPXTG anchor domain-containing protein [Bacillota bacterium]